jgi:hypothetical protein
LVRPPLQIRTGQPDTDRALDEIRRALDEIRRALEEARSDVGMAQRDIRAILERPAWIPPTLLNSWAHHSSGGHSPPGYYRDATGLVHIRGMVDSGSSGTAIFQLPAGYRPKTRFRVPAVTMSGGVQAFAAIDIQTTGDVVAQGSGTQWLALGHIAFPTSI